MQSVFFRPTFEGRKKEKLLEQRTRIWLLGQRANGDALFTDENLAQKQDSLMGRGELEAGIIIEYYLAENPVELLTLCGDHLFRIQ